MIELQKLPYDIISTAFVGIHFSLLSHVYHYTHDIASKIKDEQKKTQMNIKRRKTANSEHENSNDDEDITSISTPTIILPLFGLGVFHIDQAFGVEIGNDDIIFMILEVTYIISAFSFILSAFTIATFSSHNYRKYTVNRFIALLCVPAMLDFIVRIQILNYGDSAYITFSDIFSVIITTLILQSINFLNFHTLGLFAVFRLAPKYNILWVTVINLFASLAVNGVYIPYKLIGAKSLYIAYLSFLSVWILATLTTGTMIGFYIPVVIARAQKRSKSKLYGLIKVKYALLALGLLDWIGVAIYFYKTLVFTDSNFILIEELKQLPYDIIATAIAGIHVALLSHIYIFTFQKARKIKEERKKSQGYSKRRKSATNDDNIAEELRTNDDDIVSLYLLVLGTWIIGVLISGTVIGFYIPIVISKAQKRAKSDTLHGLITVKYALLALSVMDWLGVGIYGYEVLALNDKMTALPFDIIATAVAGLHFALLSHVYHYTLIVTSKIKEERKKSQMNSKRRKSATGDQDILADESKINEDDDTNSISFIYIVLIGLWILVVLTSGIVIGLYIPVVISKAQKRTQNTSLYGLIHVKYALLALSAMDWIGVAIYFYEVFAIDDKLTALPYDITSTAVAGIHFALLCHVYHYTYLVTMKIKEERKRSVMNSKRKKSATADQDALAEMSRANEDDDAASISVANYI
ncbi:hypothetical protein HDV06_004763 [Boothiomyces sp. JEL0866]|nr:hypothetical protein HDV06_004763 [Boothiomyces sp. JEL0866]